jgi:acyl carrier protein
MPSRYTLPFGGLDTLPGIDGVQDVTLEIPTLDEIGNAVARETLDRTDVDERLAQALVGDVALDDPFLDVLVREIEDTFQIDIPGEGALADQIVREIEAGSGIDFPDVPSLDQIDQLLDNQLPDDLAADVIENAEVDISGIFGPLSGDVEQALEDLIEFDPDALGDDIVSSVEESLGIDVPGEGDLLEDVPTLADIEGAISDALDGLSPDINGVEFWSDPIRFLEELFDARKELLADPELLAELDQAIEGEL